jgi:protein TonB
MEIKKSASKNLERKRGLFFQIGLVASLSLVLVAFQYTTPKLTPIVKKSKTYPIDDELIPIVILKSAKPLPKPAPPKPIIDQIKVVKKIAVVTPEPILPNPIELPPEIIIADMPPEIIDENEIFIRVEVMPALGDCNMLDNDSRAKCTEDAIRAFISENIRIPQSVKDRGESGKVFVSFVVNKQGNVDEVKILRGMAGAKDLDKEVKRVINLLPQFTPGEQTGRKASVRYTIPIDVRIG